jgi:hypothetical protein
MGIAQALVSSELTALSAPVRGGAAWEEAASLRTRPGLPDAGRPVHLMLHRPRWVGWWPGRLAGRLTASDLAAWDLVVMDRAARWVLVARENARGAFFTRPFPDNV